MKPVPPDLNTWIFTHSQTAAHLVEHWYERNGRQFAWRNTHDPYIIAVSEIFLKRTQARRVETFLQTFLDRFPDASLLADADPEFLKDLVAPLGLKNQRASSLKAFATHLVTELDGELPQTKSRLEEVPGLGDYSAAAVACFAFEEKQVLFDTNTVRIFKRLPAITPTKNDERWCPHIRNVGTSILESCSDCSKLNWGLLDLGALVCTSRTPNHDVCVLRDVCCSAAT